ncbi:hypothetical protein [Ralstonia insidiosa]|uniref:hypothetical protein n=1 Tax=Ralstonia insidiosa TaxID=190721 RepID=UPI001427ED14|nr:hypothetical protein [Ralstonia insidiosa]
MSITAGVLVEGTKHLAEKELVKLATKFFKEKVIGKWSEYRADAFLSAFIEELRKEQDVRHQSANLNDMLQMISRSDKQTTALFDAYRRVALSSSKKIGPMIVGMLTAHIVLGDRDATLDEELIFQAAETLNDRDFSDLESWMTYVYDDEESPQENDVRGSFYAMSVIVKSGPELPAGISLETTALGLDDAPMDIAKDVGIFALKLKNIGLLTEIVRRRENPREPGATRYCVIVSAACQQLNALSSRAMGAMSS